MTARAKGHNRPKTIVFGIDGGSWNVINPMLAAGRLPNIGRLIKEGTSGVLRSFDPSISPSVWASIATGKVPEKHGITNFFTLQDQIEAKRIWEIFEERGSSIGIAGYFMTWPPKIRNGFMIPDHFAPEPDTVPADIAFLQELTINTDIRRKLDARKFLRYGLLALRHGCRLRTMTEATSLFAKRKAFGMPFLDFYAGQQNIYLLMLTDVFVHCLKRFDPDFSILYYPGTDTLAHKYWHYYEPEHFENVPAEEIERYHDVIPAYYEKVDRSIGRILKVYGDDATIFVVSDHGFKSEDGFLHTYRLKLDKILEIVGYAGAFDLTNLGNQIILNPRRPNGKKRKALVAKSREMFTNCHIASSGQHLFDVHDYGTSIGVQVSYDFKTAIDEEEAVIGDGRFLMKDMIVESSVWSGEHFVEGIVIMKGDHLRKGHKIEGASVLDITPTLLALNGFPIAADMDGRVLDDAFDPDFIKENPISTIDSFGPPTWKTDGEVYEYDERKMREKLRTLGYLD